MTREELEQAIASKAWCVQRVEFEDDSAELRLVRIEKRSSTEGWWIISGGSAYTLQLASQHELLCVATPQDMLKL